MEVPTCARAPAERDITRNASPLKQEMAVKYDIDMLVPDWLCAPRVVQGEKPEMYAQNYNDYGYTWVTK